MNKTLQHNRGVLECKLWEVPEVLWPGQLLSNSPPSVSQPQTAAHVELRYLKRKLDYPYQHFTEI